MKMSVTTRDSNAEMMAWDTEFWGVPMGRAFSTNDLGNWAVANSVGCLCLLIPLSDQADIHRAESDGYRLMDVRVRYERETAEAVNLCKRAGADDLDTLAVISRTAFRGLTRFYADERFDRDRCDDLYEGWFWENAADPDVEILMRADASGPCAFVTVRMGDEAQIVLIAVADRLRGKGIGANLARAAIDRAHTFGASTISVVTQGCNIASQRAFTHAGFRLTNADAWLHKWYR